MWRSRRRKCPRLGLGLDEQEDEDEKIDHGRSVALHRIRNDYCLRVPKGGDGGMEIMGWKPEGRPRLGKKRQVKAKRRRQRDKSQTCQEHRR